MGSIVRLEREWLGIASRMNGRLQSYSETRGYAALAPAAQPGHPRNDYRLESQGLPSTLPLHLHISPIQRIVTIVPSLNADHRHLFKVEKQSLRERRSLRLLLSPRTKIERRGGAEAYRTGQLQATRKSVIRHHPSTIPSPPHRIFRRSDYV